MFSFLSRNLPGFLRPKLPAISIKPTLKNARDKCFIIYQSTVNFFIYEASLFHRHFSRLPASRYFANLAERISTCATRCIPFLGRNPNETSAAEPLAPELIATLEAITDGRYETLANQANQETEEPRDERSFLHEIENQRSEATVLDFDALSELGAKETTIFATPKLKDYLPETFHAITDRLRNLFVSVEERQASIVAIALEGQINYASANIKLEQQSAALARDVAALEEGNPLAIYVPLSHGSHTVAHAAVMQLGKHLNPTEAEELDIDGLKNSIRSKLHQALAQFRIAERFGDVVETVTSFKSKLLGDNPSAIRRAIVESVSEDFTTILNEMTVDVGLPETLWADLGELPAQLEGKIEQMLQFAFSSIDEKLEYLNQTVQMVLPPVVQTLMAEQKLFVAQQFAYFVLEKQGDHYTLKVYPSKRDPAFYMDQGRGYHSPLVYENIPLAKLNKDFFYRAFCYQAFLKEQGVETYALHHLKEGLLDSLLVNPVGAPNCVDRNFDDQSTNAVEFTIIKQAIIDEIGLTNEGFDKTVLKAMLEWKMDTFLKAWSYFYHHRPASMTASNVQSMLNAVKTLAKSLVEVEQGAVLTTEVYRQHYATLCDAAKSLQKMKIQLQQQEIPLAPSLQIPAELRKIVAEYCETEGTADAVETLRNLFVEVLGEDADEALNQVVNELLPTLGEQKATSSVEPVQESSTPLLQKLGFNSVLGGEELKNIRKRGVEFSKRVSLLTTMRVFSAICDFCNHSLVGTILELFLKALLAVFFPGVVFTTLMVKSIFDRVSLHGHLAITSIFPKSISNALLSLLSLYREISGYVKKRVAMMIMRSGFRVLLTEHREIFLHYMEIARGQVAREGTLSYELAGHIPEVKPTKNNTKAIPQIAVAEPAPTVQVMAPPEIHTSPADTSETFLDDSLWTPIFDMPLRSKCGYYPLDMTTYKDLNFDTMLGVHHRIEAAICRLKEMKSQISLSKSKESVAKLLLGYYHIFTALYHTTRYASFLERGAEYTPYEIQKLLPHLDHMILNRWMESLDPVKAKTDLERQKKIECSMVFIESMEWSKENYLRRICKTHPDLSLHHYWHYRFHGAPLVIYDLTGKVTLENFDEVIRNTYLTLPVDFAMDVGGHVNLNYLRWCGKALIDICLDVTEIDTTYAELLHAPTVVAPTEIAAVNSVDVLDVNLLSGTFEIDHAFNHLIKLIKQEHIHGTFNPTVFIAYFRVTAAAYCAAQRDLVSMIIDIENPSHTEEAFERKLPAPDYRFLEAWYIAQKSNLSVAQIEEIEFLLSFFRQYIPEEATPWNDAEIVKSLGANPEGVHSVFSMMVDIFPWTEDEQLYNLSSLQKILRRSTYKPFIPSPLLTYLNLAYTGEYLFKNCLHQIDEFRESHLTMFYRDLVLDRDNIHYHLENACRRIRKIESRRDVEAAAIQTGFDMIRKASDFSKRPEELIFVTQLIRRLPIPDPNTSNTLWDTVENPERILSCLHELLYYLSPNDPEMENSVSANALYVIGYHLMKRIIQFNEYPLEISGFEFISYIRYARSYLETVQCGSTVTQIEGILRYYNAGLEENTGLYDGKKSQDQIDAKLSKIVTNTTRLIIPHPRDLEMDGNHSYYYNSVTDFDERTKSFYDHLSRNEEIRQRVSQTPNSSIATPWKVMEVFGYGVLDVYKLVYHVPDELWKRFKGRVVKAREYNRDGNFVKLFVDAKMTNGERVLPPAIRLVREMEYLALALSEGMTASSYRPYERVKPLAECLVDKTDVFNEHGILAKCAISLIEGTKSIGAYGIGFAAGTKSRESFPVQYNGLRPTQAEHDWLHQKRSVGRKIGEIYPYRGEEFLRLLQMIRDDKKHILNSRLGGNLLGQYLSISLLLKENPELIHLIVREIIAIIDDPDSRTYHTQMAKLLLIVGRMAVQQNCPGGYDILQDIRHKLRNRIATANLYAKDELTHSYVDDTEIFRMGPEAQRIVLVDIARHLLKVKKIQALPLRYSDKVLNYWKPYLIEKLNQDQTLVEMVMKGCFTKYSNADLWNGPWSGTYPIFSNGTYTVNLDMLVIDPVKGLIHYNVDQHFSYEITKKVVVDIPKDNADDEIAQELPTEVKVDLSKCTHYLGLLTWFQPLADIKVFASIANPSRITKIVFSKVLNLSFNIIEREGKLRAYSENTFPDFYIAERQKHPQLTRFTNYLLMENDRGEQKVLMVPLSISQLAANIILKIGINLTLTAGITRFIPSAVNDEPDNPVVCSLDAEGDLIPDTLEGVAYLFIFHYAQGNHALALKYLAELEEQGKKGAFSEQTLKLLRMMIMPGLLGMTIEDNSVGCRVAALMYENDLLFGNTQAMTKMSYNTRICLWLMGQKTLLILKSEKVKLPIPEYTEMNLLKGLSNECRSMIGEKIPPEITQYANTFGVMNFMEGMLMHPKLVKRYAKLRKVHLDERDATIHYVMGSLLTKKTTKISFEGTILAASSDQSADHSSGMLMNALDIARVVRTNGIDPENSQLMTSVIRAVMAFDFKADAEAAPVLFSKIRPSDIKRYFCIYLCMLLGYTDFKNMNDSERECFYVKAALFRKTLFQMKGNYQSDIAPLIAILTIAENNRKILADFEFWLTSEEKLKNPSFAEQLHIMRDSTHALILKDPKRYEGWETSNVLGTLLKDRFYYFINAFQVSGNQDKFGKVVFSRGVVDTVKSVGITIAKSVIPLAKIYYNAQRAIYACAALQDWYVWGVDVIEKLQRLREKQMVSAITHGAAAETVISPEWASELQTRDQAVDGAFQYFLQKYYLVEEEEMGLPEIPEPPQLTDPASAGTAFAELLQSHHDYHQRATESEFYYTFLGDPEEFRKEFEQVRSATTARIAKEREQIVDFVNGPLRRTASRPVTLEDHLKEYTAITFDEIFSLMLKGDDEEFKARTKLDDAGLQQAKFLINLHLVAASRWDCLFQEFDKVGNGSLDALGKALALRRSYQFAGRQEKIILGFLAFEARTGKVLWKKQAEQFERMLISPHVRQVLELIMGSGKTAFGMPLINYYASDRRSFIINIWPKPTAPTNIEENSRQAKAVFNQSAWAFSFSRNRSISESTLEAFYLTLMRSQQYGEPLNMTKEDLQAIELNFIELLHSFSQKKNGDVNNSKKKIMLYCKILLFIKEYGKGNIDEGHENLSQEKELIFPIGAKKHLPRQYCKTMEKVFVWMLELDIPDLMPFRTPDALQHKIDQDYFRQEISPLLIPKAAKYFDIDPKNRDEFTRYMKGEISEPSFILEHDDFEDINLVRGLLLTLLPFGFDSIPHVNYTVSKQEKENTLDPAAPNKKPKIDKFVRPAEANDKPNESSTIQSAYEAYVKTCIFYLKKRLSVEECKELVLHLRVSAEAKAKKLNIPVYNTSQAKYFNRISGGVNLFHSSALENPETLQRLVDSDSFTMSYVRCLIGDTIEYFTSKTASNSHSLGSMLESYLSCTGSPDNHQTYPEGTVVLRDPGTQGETVAMIREKCGTDPIPILKKISPSELVDEVMDTFFQPESDYFSIIERGALFRGLPNAVVARKMLTFIELYRPEMKGIVFWNSQNIPMIWERGAKVPILYKNCRLLPHERLTYFDESHTYAADIPQPPGRGLVTFGEHTRLDGGFQAPWRIRGLKGRERSFTLTTTESVRKIMHKETVFPDDVIEFFVLNSEPFRKNANYENASKRMFNIIRAAFMDKMLRQSTAKQVLDLFAEYMQVFIEDIEDRPSVLFGGVTRRGPPVEALTIYRRTLQRYLKSRLFTSEEKRTLVARLKESTTGDFPTEVIIREGVGVDRNGLGQQIQVEQDVDNQCDNEDLQEAQNQAQNQQQQQQQMMICSIDDFEQWYWEKDLDLYRLQDWLNFDPSINVPIHRARDLCKGVLEVLADMIPQNVLTTNNFAPMLTNRGARTDFKPFISNQQPAYQLLLVQRDGETTILMIDQKEANILRKKFRADRAAGREKERNGVSFALYDMGLEALVSFGYGREAFSLEDLHDSPEFNYMTAMVKILNGSVRYRECEIEQLAEAFRGMNLKPVKKAYEKILQAREGDDWVDKYYGSALHELLLLQLRQQDTKA